VILVLVDDQGYGDLGCHGNSVVRTPNLDRLHSQSIRFTNFHVDPTCSPTRSALMTGRYSHRTGVWHTKMARNFLRRDETTMADVFRLSGYRTGIFGKWHLGGNYPFRPIDRGFQDWVGFGDGGTGTVTDYWGNKRMNDTYLRNGKWEKFSGFGTDIFFDEAMRFVAESGEEPFLLYLATNDPHVPVNVPREWLAPYQGVSRRLAHFHASIERVDYNVGRLRRWLSERGLADNTILLFATDNGTQCAETFNAGMRGIKASQYDGGHRVPLFLYWPDGGFGPPRDIDTLSAHVDVLPTLLELCNLRRGGDLPYDGVSLLPLLRRVRAPWPDRALMVESQRIQYPEKWRQCSVLTERWRLVDGRELYDAANDPGEVRDVSMRFPDVVAELRDRYEAYWESVSKRDREFCRVLVGSDRQPETVLSCSDWFAPTDDVPWDQRAVLAGVKANGCWPIEVARAGIYRFSLRRWPRETGQAINARLSMPGDDSIVHEYDPPQGYGPWRNGVSIGATQARIRAGRIEKTQPLTESDVEIAFDIKLDAGPAEVQSWFTGGSQSRGAYWVYVRAVS
jgi:arylsulfatase A-like enzyme